MPELAKYAKDKGMSREQYQALLAELNQTADNILENVKNCGKYAIDSGMYYPVNEILEDNEFTPFIICMLKKRGMEFIENNTLWRV